MAECKFSIIVPIYNVEKYLGECIQSLVDQDFADMEILLIDDGSTDRSGEICDRFAKLDARVKVYHRENKGVSAARNYGMDMAKGKYLLFVDSDDYVEKDFCKVMDQTLDETGEIDVVTFAGLEEYEGKMKELSSYMEGVSPMQTAQEFLLRCYKTRKLYFQVWMYAYKRVYIEKFHLRFIENILHEDVEFTVRAILNAGHIFVLNQPLYHYRIRENSISTQKNKLKNAKDLFYVLNLQSALAEKQEPELRRWMLNAVLNSYLNMIYEARMYRPEYRKMVDKEFLRGKAATSFNKVRVVLCTISIRLYCAVNDLYKKIKG